MCHSNLKKMGFCTQPKPNPLEQLASTFSIEKDHEIPGNNHHQSSWDNDLSIDGSSSNIQSKDTLQSIVNASCHCRSDVHFVPGQGTLLSLDQNKLLHDIESSFDPEPDYTLWKSSGGNSRRTRIKWTQDLHNKFMDSVNRLGGAEKATPRAILKLMRSKGAELTILHVKSHLQKCRYSKCTSESTEEEKHDKRFTAIDIPKLCKETSKQVKEVLRFQQDLQRHLHEQLEMQKNLQQMIEAQGRQLKVMLQEFKFNNKRPEE